MTQTVHVRLFAMFRDVFGLDVLEVSLAEGSTLADLRRRLEQMRPAAKQLLSRSNIAVNQEFAPEDTIVDSGAEIALIPPVSGG